VLVTPNEPLRALYDELRHIHPNVHLVGDALAPRDVQYAIADGHRIMRPPAPVVGDRSPAVKVVAEPVPATPPLPAEGTLQAAG
jgi:hypothetical protein